MSSDSSQSSPSTEDTRQSNGLVSVATKVLEAIGLLNKGSSESAATPSVSTAAETAGISSNALNVTRVGGLAALIAVVGAAALAIFQVNKSTDKASIVVAAYASVGAIIASALLTAAIIISSDIRARAATSPVGSPSAPTPDPSTSKPIPATVKTDPNVTQTPPTDANAFSNAWVRALSALHAAVDGLERTPDSGWVDGATSAWLDAAASTGNTQGLHPPDALANLQARLTTGQSSVIAQLSKLVDDADSMNKTAAVTRMRSVLASMDQSLLTLSPN